MVSYISIPNNEGYVSCVLGEKIPWIPFFNAKVSIYSQHCSLVSPLEINFSLLVSKLPYPTDEVWDEQ